MRSMWKFEETAMKYGPRIISTAFCLFVFWGTGKIVFWISGALGMGPEWKWVNIGLLSVLGVDMALIVSGIKPKGFASWFTKER